MTLLAQRAWPAGETRCLLRFGDGGATAHHTVPPTLLELWHRPGREPIADRHQTGSADDYWKIGITLKDVDVARDLLLARGITVSQARQFHDIGYLCHLTDPDGYVIELLQHDFAQHHRPTAPEPGYPLGSAPTLGQITLRITDPWSSLHFYQEILGMRLLSRQIVETHRFTLYFLACTEESPPDSDVDSVGNREWLWQRPYTTLELQHAWERTDRTPQKRDDHALGFWGIGFVVTDIAAWLDRLEAEGVATLAPLHHAQGLAARTAVVADPDGFRLRMVEFSEGPC